MIVSAIKSKRTNHICFKKDFINFILESVAKLIFYPYMVYFFCYEFGFFIRMRTGAGCSGRVGASFFSGVTRFISSSFSF